MFKTILFDLDDTLLKNNHNHFSQAYVKLFKRCFEDLISPQQAEEALLKAFKAMDANRDSESTNRQKSISCLSQGMNFIRT